MKPAFNKMEPIFWAKRKPAKEAATLKVHAEPDNATKHKQPDPAYKKANIDDTRLGQQRSRGLIRQHRAPSM
jgi:hypothetical protein